MRSRGEPAAGVADVSTGSVILVLARLLGESGAPTVARRDPVGHGISAEALATLAGWLQERLSFLAHRGRPEPGPSTWTALPDGTLPARPGPRPEVSSGIPQEQRSDTAPVDLQEQVFARITALPGVSTRQSAISVPGARGFQLAPPRLGPVAAFIVPSAGEFAHVHPGHDGSLHVALPPALAADVVAKGWGVAHPLAGVRLTPGMVLLFGPRDDAELETVVGVVATSHAGRRGRSRDRRRAPRRRPAHRVGRVTSAAAAARSLPEARPRTGLVSPPDGR